MKYAKFSKSTIALAMIVAGFNATAATYEVQELPKVKNQRQQFTTGLNDVGDVVGIARSSTNYPFYLENYLVGASANLRANCDIDDTEASTGEFDAGTIACLKSELTNSSRVFVSSPSYQKIGDIVSYINSGGDTTKTTLLDIVDEPLGELTRSNVEQLNDVNNSGIAIGTASAPYIRGTFQQTGEDANESPIVIFKREFENRAVVLHNGEVKTIAPKDDTYGGTSGASAISESNIVAGYESVSVREFAQETIDEQCTGEQLPVETCAWSLAQNTNIFDIRPVTWELDAEANVIKTTRYPLAFTPTEDQTRNYVAYATAINDAGVAVGFGDVPRINDDDFIITMPLLFKNGKTQQLIKDNEDFLSGYAQDINNNGVVVGYLREWRESKNKFFVYDTNTNELSTPTTFYKSAGSSAQAINDKGWVVGVAEYELTTSSQRRKHAFMYNIESEAFFDLNDLISCNSDYEIVEVADINSNNQISATAIKETVAIDERGEQIEDDDGNKVMTTTTVSVLLNPLSGGEIEQCEDIENPPYERQGMSLPVWLIASLSFFAVIRRRFI